MNRIDMGKLLWEYMKETGVNNRDLAQKIGVTPATIGNVIRGSVIPQFRVCGKIERFLQAEQDKKNQLVMVENDEKI